MCSYTRAHQSKRTSLGCPFTLVETQGLEPWTPCLQSRCSSQLSYVPNGNETNLRFFSSRRALAEPKSRAALFPSQETVVGDEGLEPPTSSLSVTRSNQLS